MKRCPTCKRTYADDSITFCLEDGSLLSAPYNAQTTPASSRTDPPPTEMMHSGPNQHALASTQQTKESTPPLPTITSALPPHNFERNASAAVEPLSPMYGSQNRKGLYWIIGILATLIVAGVALVLIKQNHGSAANNKGNQPIAQKATGLSSDGIIIEITDLNYEEEVLKSQLPVLIYFWTPWAAPSRELEPTIRDVAGEYSGKLKVGRVNSDENAGLARKFEINAIPTLILIRQGIERDRIVGVTSKETISQMLNKYGSNP
jgi:thioredoxin 1